ncbi:MAG: SET domain-containing protein-lysine N-methyltransferase [Phycisphaerales bacterium]
MQTPANPQHTLAPQPTITPAAGVQVRHTGTDMGYGVYATRRFSAGERIEVCPVILLEEPYDALPEPVRTRVYDWTTLVPSDARHQSAISLGFGSMYNHASPASVRYRAEPSIPAIVYEAVRDIEAGEEMTINYNAMTGGPDPHDHDWFSMMGITRL